MREHGTHVSTLDGVRGLAVLLVMLYHFAHVDLVSELPADRLFYRLAMTGWIGVDLFFALSGFLITGILLRSKEASRYFGVFYGRRALRIFPLYYGYLALLFWVIFPLVSHHGVGDERAKAEAVQASWPWFVLYLSNIKQTFAGVFFGAGAGHLWSLAIEEQFYVIWPLVIRYLPVAVVRRVCLVLLPLALVLRIGMAASGVSADTIWVFTLARLDGLLAGALLAIAVQRGLVFEGWLMRGMPLAFVTLVCGLAVMGGHVESSPWIYTVGLTVVALVAVGLVYTAYGSQRHPLFSHPALTFLGKYSYALYVLHPLVREAAVKALGTPRLLFGSQIPWQIAFSAACLAASVLMALLSWHLLEKRFHRWKEVFFSYREPGDFQTLQRSSRAAENGSASTLH
ncbi:acyltransferase [Trinickia symbiotica]|uniref:Acyltransferase n=1 Tax=Trinickia symbiotica TaxID=863227 RepID=A0A2T3XVR7_9BURK|nr:acyltransferase [Trinickia symbiotica]PTB20585.1 acyltransferase [Trinickia symbiotica]